MFRLVPWGLLVAILVGSFLGCSKQPEPVKIKGSHFQRLEKAAKKPPTNPMPDQP